MIGIHGLSFRRIVTALVLLMSIALVVSMTLAARTARAHHAAVPSSTTARSLSGVPSAEFYGSAFAGDTTGNSTQWHDSASVRITADKTGTLEGLAWGNRVLTQANIDDRCANNPGSSWCTCVDNDLDAYLCGYTLSNSYHVGNGGLIQLTLQSDDGTSAHLPSGSVLATANVPEEWRGGYGQNAYVPMLIGNTYVNFQWVQPVNVTAGTIYHIVLKNLRPPTLCPDTTGLTVAEAKLCDRDRGVQGTNGIYTFKTPNIPAGPYYSNHGVLLRDTPGGSWVTVENVQPWYRITYTDGEAYGNFYTYVESRGQERRIGGGSSVRQRFTVQGTDRTVTGLWIRVGRCSSNSDDLTLTLAGGSLAPQITTLAATEVPLSTACTTYTAAYLAGPIDWYYLPLSTPQILEAGTEYTVTMTSSSNGNYFTNAGFQFNSSNTPITNAWTNAYAEYSSGSTWLPFLTGRVEADLSLLFTVA